MQDIKHVTPCRGESVHYKGPNNSSFWKVFFVRKIVCREIIKRDWAFEYLFSPRADTSFKCYHYQIHSIISKFHVKNNLDSQDHEKLIGNSHYKNMHELYSVLLSTTQILIIILFLISFKKRVLKFGLFYS